MFMKKLSYFSVSFLFFWVVSFYLIAQAPANYYQSAIGKKERELKTALYNIVKDHTVLSYTPGLWNAYKDTDAKSDGTVWDMYSSISRFTFGVDQDSGSGGTTEGDKYNREHSFPQEWFNGKSPMKTDLYHVYPTDKLVNNKRGSYPFGETNGESYKSAGNFSKLGRCTYPGYSGTVFEPNDEYKGDFARSYFYMVTCYEDKVSGWNSEMLNNTSYPAFTTWAMNLLLEWNRKDPVSKKETDRNNMVYSEYQNNRNPFIDYPQLAEHIWGNLKDMPFDGTTSVEEWALDNISVFVTSGNILTVVDAPVNSILKLYNMSGELIVEHQILSDRYETEVGTEGVYIAHVITSSRVCAVKVFIR